MHGRQHMRNNNPDVQPLNNLPAPHASIRTVVRGLLTTGSVHIDRNVTPVTTDTDQNLGDRGIHM